MQHHGVASVRCSGERFHAGGRSEHIQKRPVCDPWERRSGERTAVGLKWYQVMWVLVNNGNASKHLALQGGDSQAPREAGPAEMPILEMRSAREPLDPKELGQGHTAAKQQGQDVTVGGRLPAPLSYHLDVLLSWVQKGSWGSQMVRKRWRKQQVGCTSMHLVIPILCCVASGKLLNLPELCCRRRIMPAPPLSGLG